MSTPHTLRCQHFTLAVGPTDPRVLRRLIGEAADAGMNAICIDLARGLRFASHPELAAPWALTRETLGDLLDTARARNLEVIPALALLSHAAYLTEPHPEFREPDRGIYCPAAPGLYDFLGELMDEIIDLFRPRHFHIGHDETVTAYDPRRREPVFTCPRCRREAPHVRFARDIQRHHAFLARRGIRTLMWADALLDPARFADAGFAQSGCYGGAPDNLHLAADLLPKDIVMCDWHYEVAREFPTVRYLQDLGFDTLACPWWPLNGRLFARYADQTRTPRFRGLMATGWTSACRANFQPMRMAIRGNGAAFRDPEKLPPNDPLLRQVVQACDHAGEPIPEGPFRRVFDFRLPGVGALHAMGWRDLRYIEWPQSHEPVRGPRLPRGMELRAARQGSIHYAFRCADGARFETVRLRVWMACPGRSSITIDFDEPSSASDPATTAHVVVADRTLRGAVIDLTDQVAGRPRFRLRFAGENLSGAKIILLRRFELGGTVHSRLALT